MRILKQMLFEYENDKSCLIRSSSLLFQVKIGKTISFVSNVTYQ